MKQILKTKSGIKVQNVPLPTPGSSELLVSVEASVISTGTETMDMRHGEKTIIKTLEEKKRLFDKLLKKVNENGLQATFETVRHKLNPSEQSLVYNPIGYSNAGIVVAKGMLVSGFNIGDRVACAGSGIAAHAEFVTIPVNLAVKIPENLTYNAAAFTTIGSIAMQGIRRAEVTFGETIVITGLGLLGLLAVQIAKAWGLVVIGLDLNQNRLDLAKQLGADHCFMANDPVAEKSIQELTHGNGTDAVIIYAATKSSDPANQAMRICRRKGRVVVVGAIGMDLVRDDMYLKELDFVMSTSYGPGRYDNLYEVKGIDYPIGYVRWTENRNMMEFVRLLSTGQIDINPLISNTFIIDQAAEAYQSLIDNPGKNISSLFQYHHETNEISLSKSELYPRPIPVGKIRVGIIGAGGFVQNNHLPNLLKLPELYELVAIANRTPAEAKTAGEKYKVRYITTDYNQILNDPEIDLVIIGTRHNLHAQQVADAIKAGKHVLVEKPLAMNEDELVMVEAAHIANPGIHAALGFNRRYSPFIQKAKTILAGINSPVVVNYRLNAGSIPMSSWVQDLEEGGGRIVGEVCHFIDLANYIIDSNIKDIHAISIPLDGVSIVAEDNIIITLTYTNGSMAVITYVSIGSKQMGKERIEIFAGNHVLLIEDFQRMEIYSPSDRKEENLKSVDKGHASEMLELARLIKGEKSLIMPFKNDILSTELTLNVLAQLHG